MNKNILFIVNFANFANFAKLGVKSFAFREILKTQKISNTIRKALKPNIPNISTFYKATIFWSFHIFVSSKRKKKRFRKLHLILFLKMSCALNCFSKCTNRKPFGCFSLVSYHFENSFGSFIF